MTFLPLETEGCKNNTGNVHITMRWGKNNTHYIFWVCVCSLMYPVCNVPAPHCHVPCLCAQYFTSSSHKWHDFWGI